jgi:hypothetical protein
MEKGKPNEPVPARTLARFINAIVNDLPRQPYNVISILTTIEDRASPVPAAAERARVIIPRRASYPQLLTEIFRSSCY